MNRLGKLVTIKFVNMMHDIQFIQAFDAPFDAYYHYYHHSKSWEGVFTQEISLMKHCNNTL